MSDSNPAADGIDIKSLSLQSPADTPPVQVQAQDMEPPGGKPASNPKRSDPFQFGSRFLGEDDDVFEYNAWDHVETDEAYNEYAEKQYEMQRQSPVPDFDRSRIEANPAWFWNQFYKNNQDNFFKDRKWLFMEFPVLSEVTEEDAGPKVVLEIGAGAGNTAFPVLLKNKNPDLRIHACDFSQKAVDVMRSSEAYDTAFMRADVWDVAGDELPPGMTESSADVAILIFIFSALSPEQWVRAVRNVHRVLKPGGQVCFRDYGRGDLAQVRFRKNRFLSDNFYARGDGTRVYFFERDQLEQIWCRDGATKAEGEGEPDGGFALSALGVDRRLIVNRARRIKMHRCWIQGKFVKR